MNIGEKVRIYVEDDWFDEGRIIELEQDHVIVDFLDWKQKFNHSELQKNYIHFSKIWVAISKGEILERFDTDHPVSFEKRFPNENC